jgi:hypothetical protein
VGKWKGSGGDGEGERTKEEIVRLVPRCHFHTPSPVK